MIQTIKWSLSITFFLDSHFPYESNYFIVSSPGLSVLMIVTEGSSVKVHPGGNTTLPCSIKDDREISWIITDGNQTFVRIMRLEYGYGTESKPEPSNIHLSYAGRIRTLSSSTNTHSLLLMNITDTDLMLYCCTECMLEQTHCTKLDYEGRIYFFIFFY